MRPSLAAHAPKGDDHDEDRHHPKAAPPPLVTTASAAAVNDALEFGGTLPPEFLQKKPRREVTLAPAVVPGMDSAAMVDWRLKYRAFRCGDYSGAAEYSDGCGSSPEKGRNFRSWRWGHSRYAAAAAASAASKGSQRAWTIVDLTQASGAKPYSKRTAKNKDSRAEEHRRAAKEAQAKRPRAGLSNFSTANGSSNSSSTWAAASPYSSESGSSRALSGAPMSVDQHNLSNTTGNQVQSGNRVGSCVGGSGYATLVDSSSSSGLAGGLGGSFREETILSALVDHLGFLERVACSVCSTTWHGVFYFAGACRAVHTLLPVFHNCSRTFLLGALEHSVRSLVTCGLVNRSDLTPNDFHAKVGAHSCIPRFYVCAKERRVGCAPLTPSIHHTNRDSFDIFIEGLPPRLNTYSPCLLRPGPAALWASCVRSDQLPSARRILFPWHCTTPWHLRSAAPEGVTELGRRRIGGYCCIMQAFKGSRCLRLPSVDRSCSDGPRSALQAFAHVHFSVP